jgi:phosphatidylglycerophosphate synthase
VTPSMMIRHLPNALSLVRLAGLPPLLIAAMTAGSRAWFFGLLCVAWVTDALDGWVARQFNAVTERGRMLDSWGDYVTTLLCVVGVAWLWPEIMARELPWFATGVVGFFAIVIYGLVRHGRPPAYHTWLAKTVAVATPFALAALLLGWSALPFHGVVVLQVLGTVEEMVIAILLPGIAREIPSTWHAWRLRQAPSAMTARPRRPR